MADIAFSSFANIFRIYVIFRFMRLFFQRSGINKKLEILLYAFLFVLVVGGYNAFHNPVVNIITNLSGMFLITLLYNDTLLKKLLIVVMIYSVNMLVDSFVILSLTDYYYGMDVAGLLEGIASTLFLLIEIVTEHFLKKPKSRPASAAQGILFIVPIITLGMMLGLVIKVTEHRSLIIYLCIGLLIINIIIFYLYDAQSIAYERILQEKSYQQQLESYQNQIAVMQGSENRIRALYHDMKHHIVELKLLTHQNDADKTTSYLNEMEKFITNPNELVVSQNPEIDSILNLFLLKAKEILLKVDIDISIPKELSLNSFDMNIILGNILENAITAASKSNSKYLGIRIWTDCGVLLIKLKNSYTGSIIRENGVFSTTKRNKIQHGIGLENVKKTLEKYHGVMDIHYDNSMFLLDMMIYLNNDI